MNDFKIEYCSYKDNNELLNILLEVPILSKTLGYYTDKRPNFFTFLENIYDEYEVISIKKNNQIIGFVTVSFYNVFLNKKITKVTYLSELRLKKEFRKLKLAEELLKQAVKISGNSKIFTCIATDNKIARKKWNNLAEENIINLKNITNINTYFILPIKTNINNKFFIRNANEKDIKEIFDLWNLYMINKNLSQYFSFEKFNNFVNLIGINNFIVCIYKNKIVSFLSLWNQYNIRKFILSNNIKYSKVFNYLSKFLKIPKLPNKNEIIKFYCITNMCIPIEYTDTFKYLINYSIKYIKNSYFLALALDEKDILNYELKNFYYSKSQLELLSNYENSNLNFHLEISYG